MTLASPVTEKAMPLKVARSGRGPTISWTYKVTIGCTVRTPNCAIISTKNNANRTGAFATATRLLRIDRLPGAFGGATKRSSTANQTRASDNRIVAEVQ